MRVASFNVLHGRSLADGLTDPDRLARAVERLDVDVLALQEVDRDQVRSQRADHTAVASKAAGAAWSRFGPTLLGTPGAHWVAAPAQDTAGEVLVEPIEGGELSPAYGVALVSRWPVRSWHTVRLPQAPLRSPVLMPGLQRRVALLPDEPRIGLAAVVDTPAGAMTIASTHLSFVPGWNAFQLRRLCRALEQLPGPRLLLGDLNLPGRLPGWISRWHELGRTATYPADRPRVQLDHALGSGALPAVRSVRAQRLELSDHCALVVDLEG